MLSRMDFGEADRILTIYAWHGKLRVIAKVAPSAQQASGPISNIAARTRLIWRGAASSTSSPRRETVDASSRLQADLDAFGHASHMARILTSDARSPGKRSGLRSPGELAAHRCSDGLDPFYVTRHYELALLTILGYRPEYRCVSCGAELMAEANAFSSRLGGMLCPRCRGADAGSRPLTVNAQKYLRSLDRRGLSLRRSAADRRRPAVRGGSGARRLSAACDRAGSGEPARAAGDARTVRRWLSRLSRRSASARHPAWHIGTRWMLAGGRR